MAEQTGGIELFKMFGDVFLKGADTVVKQLDGLDKKAAGISKTLIKVGESMAAIGKTLTLGLTMPLVAAAGGAIKLASDLQETMNKIDVVFGDSATVVKDWAKSSITSMGLAQDSALNMTATIGDMATGMGFSASEAAKLGMELTQRAADMASFKNISIDIAKTALVGVFTGETESLKQMGVVMTEANLQYYALSKGIKTAYTEMDQQEKVQLRLQYVMEMTKNSAGDFIRTQGGVANQTRMVKESIKELGASFGQILLPAMSGALQWVNKLLKGFIDLPEGTKKTIITLGAVVAAIGPVTWALGLLSRGIGNLIPIIGKVVTAFGSGGFAGALGALLGPTGIIILAIAAIAAIGFAISKIGEKSRAATAEIVSFVNSLKDSSAAHAATIDNITKESRVIQELTDKLFNLANKENKSTEEKARMASIVGQLNTLLPEMNLAIDEQTGLLNRSEQAIRDYIAAKKDELLQRAREERLIELYKERLTLEEKITTARERLNKAIATSRGLGALDPRVMAELEEARKAYILLTGAQDGTKESIIKLERSTDDYARTMENAKDGITGAVHETTDMTGRELARYEQYLKSAADVAGETGDSIVASGGKTVKLTYAQWQEQQKTIKDALTYVEDEVSKHYEAIGRLDQAAIEQKKFTLRDLIRNLGEQITAYRNWRVELEKLYSKPGLTDAMIEELKTLGPEYTALLQEINAATGPELDKLIALFNQKFGLAVGEAQKQLGRIPGIISIISGQSGTALATAIGQSLAQIQQNITDWIAEMNGGYAPATKPATGGGTTSTGPGAGYYFPQYSEGTSYVPETGLALLHQGEQVIPPGASGQSVVININNAKLFNQKDARELANLIYQRWQLAGVR